jgi:hypothetical protein
LEDLSSAECQHLLSQRRGPIAGQLDLFNMKTLLFIGHQAIQQ